MLPLPPRQPGPVVHSAGRHGDPPHRPVRREPVSVELGPAWPGFTTRGREPTVVMGTPPVGDLARAAAADDHRPYFHWEL